MFCVESAKRHEKERGRASEKNEIEIRKLRELRNALATRSKHLYDGHAEVRSEADGSSRSLSKKITEEPGVSPREEIQRGLG